MKATLLIIGIGLLLVGGLVPAFNNTTQPTHKPACPGNTTKVARVPPVLHQISEQMHQESFSFIDDVALNLFPVLKKLI